MRYGYTVFFIKDDVYTLKMGSRWFSVFLKHYLNFFLLIWIQNG